MQSQVWEVAGVEPPISPDIPIVDCHHHFWGDGHGGPALFGKLMPEIFLAEIARSGHRIIATVFAECGWAYRSSGPAEFRCVGETEYVEAVATEFADTTPKLAAGIVGSAALLLGDAVAPVLEAHIAASPTRFRGIRDWLSSDPDMPHDMGIPPEKSRDPGFRAGFAQLGRLGLGFEVLCTHPQLDEIAELAAMFPNVPIILNHLGGYLGVGRFAADPDEAFAGWQKKIGKLAQYENVSMKLSGVGMAQMGFGWDAADPPDSSRLAAAIRPFVLAAVDAFSPARCMFASNFPVDGVSFGYGVLWNAFKRVAAAFSIEEQNALFSETAARVYRVEA
jgi:predicted TIM-barrel fold metal-dependent hydrolase